MTPAINKSIKTMVFGGSWIAKPSATATSPIACLLAAAARSAHRSVVSSSIDRAAGPVGWRKRREEHLALRMTQSGRRRGIRGL